MAKQYEVKHSVVQVPEARMDDDGKPLLHGPDAGALAGHPVIGTRDLTAGEIVDESVLSRVSVQRLLDVGAIERYRKPSADEDEEVIPTPPDVPTGISGEMPPIVRDTANPTAEERAALDLTDGDAAALTTEGKDMAPDAANPAMPAEGRPRRAR